MTNQSTTGGVCACLFLETAVLERDVLDGRGTSTAQVMCNLCPASFGKPTDAQYLNVTGTLSATWLAIAPDIMQFTCSHAFLLMQNKQEVTNSKAQASILLLGSGQCFSKKLCYML